MQITDDINTQFAELSRTYQKETEAFYNVGEEDEPGASVGHGVEKCGDNCGSSKVRWNIHDP